MISWNGDKGYLANRPYSTENLPLHFVFYIFIIKIEIHSNLCNLQQSTECTEFHSQF